jgi:hypothetical protein
MSLFLFFDVFKIHIEPQKVFVSILCFNQMKNAYNNDVNVRLPMSLKKYIKKQYRARQASTDVHI